jgi:hypothetical protein
MVSFVKAGVLVPRSDLSRRGEKCSLTAESKTVKRHLSSASRFALPSHGAAAVANPAL